jgi:hypothetical protein
MTSSTLPPDVQEKVTKYWEKMGNLNLLMGTLTAQDHKRSLDDAIKNREAESAAVRERVWGVGGSGGEMSEEEMGDQIVLGDIRTENRYITPEPSKTSSIGKTLAAAGLAAAGLGAGVALPIAAWNMTRPDQAPFVDTDTDTDTNSRYGLKIFRQQED